MGHNHEKVFDMILVFGLLILIAAFLIMNSDKIFTDSNKLAQCIQDSDCTLVDSGCCGCNMGGEKTAINKYYLGYWNGNLSRSCNEVYCPAEISRSSTCSAEAKCMEGVCKAAIYL